MRNRKVIYMLQAVLSNATNKGICTPVHFLISYHLKNSSKKNLVDSLKTLSTKTKFLLTNQNCQFIRFLNVNLGVICYSGWFLGAFQSQHFTLKGKGMTWLNLLSENRIFQTCQNHPQYRLDLFKEPKTWWFVLTAGLIVSLINNIILMNDQILNEIFQSSTFSLGVAYLLIILRGTGPEKQFMYAYGMCDPICVCFAKKVVSIERACCLVVCLFVGAPVALNSFYGASIPSDQQPASVNAYAAKQLRATAQIICVCLAFVLMFTFFKISSRLNNDLFSRQLRAFFINSEIMHQEATPMKNDSNISE
ncbi:hypothetical protein EGR_03040 [Echinococcus granulosus]|uniref:Uncharacterized protein n=1 Tax=Echinococcus granulosus TaxID=6210 RepID=W6V6K2_ECHGR|nr:hypothetical protein EGR_03040 [Echinococcus granulosus]EUB62019.1 hypothetical protein EGR_03040 [Echinococcus granulosus]